MKQPERDLTKHLNTYTTREIDNDGSIYLVKRAEVSRYHDHNEQLNAIFKRFKDQSEQQLFIIGNYLYFTLNGVKWYECLTSTSWEWENIEDLIEQISPLVSDIAYEWGRLD